MPASHSAMDNPVIAAACDRIETAIARITAAAAAPKPEHDLQRRHDLLREAAASSLLMIDALLAAHGPEGETGDR